MNMAKLTQKQIEAAQERSRKAWNASVKREEDARRQVEAKAAAQRAKIRRVK